MEFGVATFRLATLNSLQRCKPLLGTFVEVFVQDNVSDKALVEQSNAIFKQIEQIEGLMSFHTKDSELSLINQQAHQQPVAMSQEMTEVIQQVLELSALTQGVYDVSIASQLITSGILPDHDFNIDPLASWKDIIVDNNDIYFIRPLVIDLGGIAKGYAVDKAIAAADDNCHVVVNAGGDLKMTHWQNQLVSIRVPYSKSGKVVDVAMQSAALATSGHYFLDGKVAIINAQTKQKVDQDISISVFADSCMVADALTKVAFLYEDSAAIFSAFKAKALRLDWHGEVLT
ncbi:MAG: hypothetical protein COB23_07455 [Methylophaga sp.]|nr:MAG: hypothetical protein COB23_07455 [Methylophaga sp.]